MMKKIMQTLFLSCLKATELIEKKMYFGLSRTEKIQLSAHKKMCSACKNYEKQSQLIDKAILASNNTEFNEVDLKELKTNIKHKLDHLKR